MKRRLRTLERDWWDNILDEWRGAKEIGDMDSVYRILRQLGTRNCKPNTGTTKTDEFKADFEKVSKDRYEADPVSLIQAVHKMADRRSDPKAIEANNKLNEPPTTSEI